MDPLETLKTYTRFPSVSTDPAYAEGMQGARDFMTSLLEKLGFEVELVETDLHPILYAERISNPDPGRTWCSTGTMMCSRRIRLSLDQRAI